MCFNKVSISLLTLLSTTQEVSSFLTINQRQNIQFLKWQQSGQEKTNDGLITTTCLQAKGGTKKKASKAKGGASASSGGFGKVTERTTLAKSTTETDDYVAFPALEEKIKQTLIPSDPSLSENSQDLSQDIYNRLAQIYGFENFNYPEGWFDQDDNKGNNDGVKGSISFDELLSAGSQTSSNINASEDFGDLIKSSRSPSKGSNDFAELIASATGGDGSSQLNVEDSVSDSSIAISNLKQFSKFRVLHIDPMILAVDDFFTSEECDKYVNFCKAPLKRTSNNDMPMMSRSKTVGRDSFAQAQRTSTTWYHHFKNVPELLAKVS